MSTKMLLTAGKVTRQRKQTMFRHVLIQKSARLNEDRQEKQKDTDMEKTIKRIADCIARAIDKTTDALFPLSITILALILICVGIECAKNTDIPDYAYGAIFGIFGGGVLWVLAISLAIGGLYDSE